VSLFLGVTRHTLLMNELLTIPGPDASPIVVPLREFGMENQRMLPCLPQTPIVQSAFKKRLLLSWWDREVHIWNIHKTSKAQNEEPDSDSESENSNRSRRLMAKVMIKGEANITSASITTDGSLLAVSTSAEIKIFRLKALASQNEDALRVSKLDVAMRLSSGGGRLLQFSPDGKWLCIVRRDNQVVVARVHRYSSSSVRILPTLTELDRLDRKIEKRALLGGLGAYERIVSRVAFSSDSRILAVSDLAGYIDTWVLEGHEDPSEATDNNMTRNDASLPSSSDHSDSDDEEREKHAIIYGQHWIRNPMAASIPKLPTMAVVLAFRPFPSTANETRSHIATHPTRHNLHPHSKDLSKGEDRLIIVNAGGRVFEFAVLKGALSAWSRRNPTANFPNEFKDLRDQAMGCLWDFGDSKERLWLYGSNWMWMFDLSRDFPVDPTVPERLTNGNMNGNDIHSQHSQHFKKRKRDERHGFGIDELRKGTSGAGSKVPDENLGTGMSRKHQKVLYEGSGMEWSILNHHQRSPGVNMDELDEQMGGNEEGLALEQLRHGEDAAPANGNGCRLSSEEEGGEAGRSSHYWHTYKYRPIMGIVPIDGEAGLEVVLVERPTWEMDLPPRYYGDQEWEKPGI
jgi:U3 small nucleolar RNA-associated protein 4